MKRADQKILSKSKCTIAIILLFCVGLLVADFIKFPASARANTKNTNLEFVSQKLLSAVEKITPGAFYESKIHYPKTLASASNKPQNQQEEKRLSYARAMHYEKVADKLCDNISEAYLDVLERPIKDKDIFTFTNELSAAIQGLGGYILPLHSTHGYLNAKFYNPDWDTSSNDIGGNRKFANDYNKTFSDKERNLISAAFRDNGIIEVDTDPANISWHRKYRTFMEYALSDKKLELKDEKFVLDIVQPYLFILKQNPNSVTQDIVYLYLEFPYRIAGSNISHPQSLYQRDRATNSVCEMKSAKECIQDKRYEPEVKCYARSTNLMHAQADDQNRYQNNKAVSMVLAGSPLGYPINDNFINGKPYTLHKSEFIKPSLECWLNAVADNNEAMPGCLNSSYADEFLSMINKDICLRKSGVTEIPTQSYPLSFPYGYPEYLITQFNETCDPPI